MSKQIAVRLPDELVDFVDGVVESGARRSRAAVVTQALDRERGRMVAAICRYQARFRRSFFADYRTTPVD